MFPIFSLGGITDADNDVLLRKHDGKIIDTATGEEDALIKRYGVYWLKMVVDPQLLQPQDFPATGMP